MIRFSRLGTSGILALLLIASFIWAGCSGDNTGVTAPQDEGSIVSVSGRSNPAIRSAMEVQMRHTAVLMATDFVAGTATGMDDQGAPVILVLTEQELPTKTFPLRIEGLKVQQLVVGKLVAMKDKPGGGGGGGGKLDLKGIQSPPIQLGTSGGWTYDLANGFCCGGTLGSLIQIGGNKYILSNYHVL